MRKLPILTVCLGWGLVWKLLLSRLGLFKEMFGDLSSEKRGTANRSGGERRAQCPSGRTRTHHEPDAASDTSRQRTSMYVDSSSTRVIEDTTGMTE